MEFVHMTYEHYIYWGPQTTHLLQDNNSFIPAFECVNKFVGFDIPQLHCSLFAAQQNLVQVSVWMHQCSYLEISVLKLYFQIQFWNAKFKFKS